MNLFIHSVKSAINNIIRSKLINFLSLGIIALTLLIFGIFNYITHSLEKFTNTFSKNIEAVFYLHDQVNSDQVNALIKNIQESLLVSEVKLISRQQASVEFSRKFPDLKYLLDEFPQSPFPASIEVKFKQENNLEAKVIAFVEDIEKLSVVESKEVNIDWANRINIMRKFVSVVGIFLSFILIFVSTFIIFNVIKLNIFYKKDEINVLRLVGAQDWYIRFPFIIEGTLLGLIGSLLASVLLTLVLQIFPRYVHFIHHILKGMIDFNTIPTEIFIKIIALGCGIGFFSSFFSIRTFMKD
jgi:cell division transport system permease protein